MNKTTIIFFAIAIVILLGGGYFFTKNSETSDESLANVDIKPEEIEITPQTYDIGKVVMKNGLVTKEYEIKNKSSNPIRLKKIVTSCMCTKAQAVAGDERTRFYAMEMNGAVNPTINFDIPANESAKLIVRFDPAAHGLQGVGQVDRKVWLSFLGLKEKKEVSFYGEVILQ